MGKYNFDEVHNRINTDSIKWDFGKQRMGRDDLLPMWVADMDFKLFLLMRSILTLFITLSDRLDL